MVRYLRGDATKPMGEGINLIFHVCNNQGKWGAGFTGALSKKWSTPESSYRNWYVRGKFQETENVFSWEGHLDYGREHSFTIGNIQVVRLSPNLLVVNAIAQNGVRNYRVDPNSVHIDYDALENCLRKTKNVCNLYNCNLHMPMVGAGHAGGDWGKIEKIIDSVFKDREVLVYQYT